MACFSLKERERGSQPPSTWGFHFEIQVEFGFGNTFSSSSGRGSGRLMKSPER